MNDILEKVLYLEVLIQRVPLSRNKVLFEEIYLRINILEVLLFLRFMLWKSLYEGAFI